MDNCVVKGRAYQLQQGIQKVRLFYRFDFTLSLLRQRQVQNLLPTSQGGENIYLACELKKMI